MAIISWFLQVIFILSELWTPSWLAVCSLMRAILLPPVDIIRVSTLNSNVKHVNIISVRE